MIAALACILLVFALALGLARPLLAPLRLSHAEALVAGAGLSLVIAWLVGWAVFTAGLPLEGYLLPLVASLVFAALHRQSLACMFRDPEARDLAVGQTLVTLWCVVSLAFIRSHSGGAWLDDWLEHWQRALFLLHQWPLHTPFISVYDMPARPPMTNQLCAMLLWATRVDYAEYQVAMAVLASLAFLPVGLLAQRFGGTRAARVAAVLVMLNPMFFQNATYPWTKLGAAFFVLGLIYFFLKLRDETTLGSAILCGVFAGAAVVAHYSAGPYVLVIAGASAALALGRRGQAGIWRAAVAGAGACALVTLPWFAWSLHTYGGSTTFLSNSSVTSFHRWEGGTLAKILLNLRDTLVPSQIRGFSGQLMRQSSPWGNLRDQAFLVYQVNLPLAWGLAGWLVVGREAFLAWGGALRSGRIFWSYLIGGFVLLGVAVYGDREHYGIAHICLVSTVLLGIAFMASRWQALPAPWKRILCLGLAIDFILGIALQLCAEDFTLDRLVHPGLTLESYAASYNVVAQANLQEKLVAHLLFFADIVPAYPAAFAALLGLILAAALGRCRAAA